jgi:hypothetical protein
MNIRTADEVLKPYIERPFRHTEIIEKDNALLAMKVFADQFRGIQWIAMSDQKPRDYERVIWFDTRDNAVQIGYFVLSQTTVSYASHWMPIPATPELLQEIKKENL